MNSTTSRIAQWKWGYPLVIGVDESGIDGYLVYRYRKGEMAGVPYIRPTISAAGLYVYATSSRSVFLGRPDGRTAGGPVLDLTNGGCSPGCGVMLANEFVADKVPSSTWSGTCADRGACAQAAA
jgi:hypothetical protein